MKTYILSKKKYILISCLSWNKLWQRMFSYCDNAYVTSATCVSFFFFMSKVRWKKSRSNHETMIFHVKNCSSNLNKKKIKENNKINVYALRKIVYIEN